MQATAPQHVATTDEHAVRSECASGQANGHAVPAQPVPSPTHGSPAHSSPDAPKRSWNRGNKHAGKHFLRATDWPADAKTDAEPARGMRRDVLKALRTKHGVTSNRQLPQHALALVGTLYRHEKRCRLAERWLRIEKNLPLADRLRLLEIIGAATESRDKVLERLGLATEDKAGPASDWAAMLASQRPTATPESFSSTTPTNQPAAATPATAPPPA